MLTLPPLPEKDQTCLNCALHTSPINCPGLVPGQWTSDSCECWKESHASLFGRVDAFMAEQMARIAEDNEVCICGCPASEHESLGEDGEQCGHEAEGHVCLRVAPAVRDLYVEMRGRVEKAKRESAEIARLRDALESVEHSCEADAEKQLRPSVMRDEFMCLAATCRDALNGGK